MNVLTKFEQRIGAIFEGNIPGEQKPFSFRRLAKRAVREMEDETFVIDGVDTAPALYTILVSEQDDELMRPIYVTVTNEISQLVEAQAKKRGYTFVGRPLVRFMVDPSLRPGRFSVFAENIDPRTLARLRDEERAYLGITPPREIRPDEGFVPEPVPVRELEPAPVAQEVAYVPEDYYEPEPQSDVVEGVPEFVEDYGDGMPAENEALEVEVIEDEPVYEPAYEAAYESEPVYESEPAYEPEPMPEPEPTVIPEPEFVPEPTFEPEPEPAHMSAATIEPEPIPAPSAVNPAIAAAVASVASIESQPAPAPEPEPEFAATDDAGLFTMPNAEPAPEPEPAPSCTLTDLETGHTYHITTERAIIGRERTPGGVILRDPNASRRHAELFFNRGSWRIRDLNSTNGTLLNDMDVPEAALRDRDVLTIGLTNLEFRAN